MARFRRNRDFSSELLLGVTVGHITHSDMDYCALRAYAAGKGGQVWPLSETVGDSDDVSGIYGSRQVWHAEHAYFNRLLDLLHRQVDVFPTGEQPNYELMLDIISYLRDYSDQYHHPREDVAFAGWRSAAPSMEHVLARLRQEHRVIAHAGETLRNHIEAVLSGDDRPASRRSR
jgi:hypothetical protein